MLLGILGGFRQPAPGNQTSAANGSPSTGSATSAGAKDGKRDTTAPAAPPAAETSTRTSATPAVAATAPRTPVARATAADVTDARDSRRPSTGPAPIKVEGGDRSARQAAELARAAIGREVLIARVAAAAETKDAAPPGDGAGADAPEREPGEAARSEHGYAEADTASRPKPARTADAVA